MSLLWECLVELSHLSVTECASEGSETELLIAWFLQMLSYALRSGSFCSSIKVAASIICKTVCSLLRSHSIPTSRNEELRKELG